MSRRLFACLIAVALCLGATAGAYKPLCKDSSGRTIQCAGTLDNTQAPTSPAMSGANITANTVDPLALTPGTVDSTEFGYLNGLTANVQSKLDELAADVALASVGGNTFYLQEVASDIATYETLRTQPSMAAEDFDERTVSSATSPVLMDAYITEPGAPGLNAWPAGNWIVHVHGTVDNNTGVTQLLARVYSRTSGGTETLLFSATSPEMDTGTSEYQWNSVEPEFVVGQTDRLVVKIYATTTSAAARTVRTYYQGTTQTSYVVTPIPSPLAISGAANQVLATPNGSGGAVALRKIVNADLTSAVIGLTQPAAGLTVTSSVALGAAATFALADDLAAVEGLTGTGIAARTGISTWAVRTVTAGDGMSVTNGDGVSGNPTVAVDSTVVRTSGTQTIGGAKQFTTAPTMSGANIMSASIQNSALANPSATINTTSPIAGGGTLTLGNSLTLSLTTSALPNATNGTSVLPGTYSVTGPNGTWQRVGVALSLPSSGTYQISCDVRGLLLMSSGAGALSYRLYNTTDAAAVSNSERLGLYAWSASSYYLGTASLTQIVKVAAAKTIDLQAMRDLGTTYTQAQIDSDASGRTQCAYIKLY